MFVGWSFVPTFLCFPFVFNVVVVCYLLLTHPPIQTNTHTVFFFFRLNYSQKRKKKKYFKRTQTLLEKAKFNCLPKKDKKTPLKGLTYHTNTTHF